MMQHPSHRQLHITPIEDPLYAVLVIDNPEQFASRYRHYHTCARTAEDAGAVPITVETAYGNRKFEVTDAANPHHVQVRVETALWRKENLQNIGVASLPIDWRYVALIDADFNLTRPDWAQATKQALERYDAVQLFGTYTTLGSNHLSLSCEPGFMHALRKAQDEGCATDTIHGAPGGAWAFRRSAWSAVGGMLETPILGSADWYMAYALANQRDELREEELQKCAPAYVKSVTDWCDQARKLRGNVSHIQNHAVHYWHGPIEKRGYEWRWKILRTWKYDPSTDIRRGHRGVIELADNKPGMRDEIGAYLRSRDEDQL